MESQNRRSLVVKASIFFAACITAACLFYFTAGHALIDAMYHGKAWGYLNHVTKSEYPLSHYLTEGDRFVSGFIVCLCVLWLLSLLAAVPHSFLNVLHKLQNHRKTTGLLSLLFFFIFFGATYYEPITPLGLFACWLGLLCSGLFWMKNSSNLALGRLACVVLLAVFLVPFIFWIVKSPEMIDYMFDEDTFGENLSVLFPAFSSFLLFRLFFSRMSLGEKRNIFFLLFAVFFFFVAAEEFSWGQRLLGLKTPAALKAINTQGEINLHNIRGAHPNEAVTLALMVLGVMIPVANATIKPFKNLLNKISFPVFPPMACVAAIIGLIFDLIWRLGYHHQADEIRELFLYVGFLIFAFNLYLKAKSISDTYPVLAR